MPISSSTIQPGQLVIRDSDGIRGTIVGFANQKVHVQPDRTLVPARGERVNVANTTVDAFRRSLTELRRTPLQIPFESFADQWSLDTHQEPRLALEEQVPVWIQPGVCAHNGGKTFLITSVKDRKIHCQCVNSGEVRIVPLSHFIDAYAQASKTEGQLRVPSRFDREDPVEG